MVKDAIGRRWQLGTIQVDYNLPERFELEYMGSDNQKHRPVMIHRAPFGSMERFVAVLIEHTAGKFPLWLTPEQVVILPISEKFNDYAEQVKMYLNSMWVWRSYFQSWIVLKWSMWFMWRIVMEYFVCVVMLIEDYWH